MQAKRKKLLIATIAPLTLAAVFTAGCGGSGSGGGSKSTESPSTVTEPVTLTMIQYGSGITDQEFQSLIADPVKKKYPNITVEMHRMAQGETLQTMVTAGSAPDIIFSGILDVTDFKDMGLTFDLNDMIKKNKMDLKAFEPDTIAMVKKYGDNGEMFAMPYSLGFPVMYYNKDIFDKFAVPYPTEGMTWDDVIALAKRVTRTDSGVQYKGFGAVAFPRLSLSMLQEKVDPTGQKALLTTDGWKQAMQVYKDFTTIPGNTVPNAIKEFTNKTLAMYAAYNGDLATLEELDKSGNGFNWDMTTFPTFPANKGVVDTPLQLLSITSASQHKDAAFLVLQTLTNKENQMMLSKAARPPVLVDADIKKAFGQDYASLKGKNTASVFKYKHLPINVKSDYEPLINPEINKAAAAVVKGDDINTALRTAEDNANKAIADYKTTKK